MALRDDPGPSSVVPDADAEQPPIIRRAELVAFALLALLLITVVAVLFIARSLFMPIVAAFVIGTMLSAGAAFLARYGVPRAVSTVLMLGGTLGIVALVVGLLSAPLFELPSKLPELNAQLRDKLHIFDRPLALWRDLQTAFGGHPGETAVALPKIEWVQPTLEFLSPTLTELLLFAVTLILFVASWPDLRRSLILTFAAHETRLRTLRILNAIEQNLGSYLLTVTAINIGVGVATGLIASFTGMPNPAGLGALAATLNYIPIIGPVVTFLILLVVGIISASTFSAGLLPALLFAVAAFFEGHFITPTIIGRRLELNALAVFIAFSFWTWLWGPIGAFLASPMLIVALVLKEHLMPAQAPQLPEE
jgi:predicted PurR-regulated permease PerM